MHIQYFCASTMELEAQYIFHNVEELKNFTDFIFKTCKILKEAGLDVTPGDLFVKYSGDMLIDALLSAKKKGKKNEPISRKLPANDRGTEEAGESPETSEPY